jgi:uncharacterized cupin superfamily protein
VAEAAEEEEAVYDVVGEAAPVANAAEAQVRPGDVLRRPRVRISLTFRHIAHPSG